MFDRRVADQINAQFNRRNGTSMQRMDGMAEGMTTLMEGIFAALGQLQGVWENGAKAKVENTSELGEQVPDSQFTKAYWKAALIVFNVFTIAMQEMTFEELASLAVTDGSGNVVLDENGNPIQPFAVFTPAELLQTLNDGSSVNWADQSAWEFTYSDPTTLGVDNTEPLT